MAYKVVLDAGHGGYDTGATGYGRVEKDDNLELTLAVGKALQNLGVDVEYTRTDDRYDSPLKKAQMANEAGADLFVSIHRNAATYNNRYNGVQTLIYDEQGIKKEVADAINEALSEVGFKNVGTETRKNLTVLKRTEMPALLVEAGFIDSEIDNQIWDESFDEMAQAIADAIYNTAVVPYNRMYPTNSDTVRSTENTVTNETEIPYLETEMPEPMNRTIGTQEDDVAESYFETVRNGKKVFCYCYPKPEPEEEPFYQIQTGLFRVYQNAVNMKRKLERDGYPVVIQLYKDLYAVRTGFYSGLKEANEAEKNLRKKGYDTLIIATR